MLITFPNTGDCVEKWKGRRGEGKKQQQKSKKVSKNFGACAIFWRPATLFISLFLFSLSFPLFHYFSLSSSLPYFHFSFAYLSRELWLEAIFYRLVSQSDFEEEEEEEVEKDFCASSSCSLSWHFVSIQQLGRWKIWESESFKDKWFVALSYRPDSEEYAFRRTSKRICSEFCFSLSPLSDQFFLISDSFCCCFPFARCLCVHLSSG